jgi:hypothetical protein
MATATADTSQGTDGAALMPFVQSSDLQFDLIHDAIALALSSMLVALHQLTQMRCRSQCSQHHHQKKYPFHPLSFLISYGDIIAAGCYFWITFLQSR